MRIPGFPSSRERHLWVWALVVVVAIYSTADLARKLADALRESGLLELTSDMFNVGMLLVGAMILVQGLRERSRGVEVGFALGIAAIVAIGFARVLDGGTTLADVVDECIAGVARNGLVSFVHTLYSF